MAVSMHAYIHIENGFFRQEPARGVQLINRRGGRGRIMKKNQGVFKRSSEKPKSGTGNGRCMATLFDGYAVVAVIKGRASKYARQYGVPVAAGVEGLVETVRGGDLAQRRNYHE